MGNFNIIGATGRALSRELLLLPVVNLTQQQRTTTYPPFHSGTNE
jgi:hypothetical protein